MPEKKKNYYFTDRADAAQKLFDVLPTEEIGGRELIVVALSEGGTIVADIIARELGVNMQVLLSEPVLAPKNDELVIAQVSETQEVVINKSFIDSFEIDRTWVYEKARELYETNIASYKELYRGGKDIASLEDKVVLLIDECVETDMTALLAIKSMISQNVKNVYLAVPVLDRFSLEMLEQTSDGVYAPYIISDYISIEYYYEELPKPTAQQLKRIIKSYE